MFMFKIPETHTRIMAVGGKRAGVGTLVYQTCVCFGTLFTLAEAIQIVSLYLTYAWELTRNGAVHFTGISQKEWNSLQESNPPGMEQSYIFQECHSHFPGI